MAGLFGIGQAPTGEKDPFGLRRASLGVIRILVERQLPLRLFDLVNGAFERRPGLGKAHVELQSFIYDRARGYFREQGYSANEVEAVFSLNPTELALVPKRLEAVRAFSALPEAESLAAANKRIVNMAMELMGARTIQRMAAEMDARAHLAPPVREFGRIAVTDGLKAALEWRDSKFGDSRDSEDYRRRRAAQEARLREE